MPARDKIGGESYNQFHFAIYCSPDTIDTFGHKQTIWRNLARGVTRTFERSEATVAKNRNKSSGRRQVVAQRSLQKFGTPGTDRETNVQFP